MEIIVPAFAELQRRSVMESTVSLAHGQPSLTRGYYYYLHLNSMSDMLPYLIRVGG